MTRIKLSTRERILLIVTVAVASFLLIWLAGIEPLREQRRALSKDLARTEKLLLEQRKILKSRSVLVSRYEAAKNTASRSSNCESDLELIQELQYLSTGLVEVTSMRPMAQISGSRTTPGLEFDCKSSLQNMVRLLHRMEKEACTISVVSMHLSSGTAPDTLRAHLYIEAEG